MLFHQRQHVWATYLHKPAIVLNVISENLCQIDTGNGPVLVHMSDLQPFATAYDMASGVSTRPADVPHNRAVFDMLERDFDIRAERARYRPEIKTRR